VRCAESESIPTRCAVALVRACLFPSTTNRLFSPVHVLSEGVQLHRFRCSPDRILKAVYFACLIKRLTGAWGNKKKPPKKAQCTCFQKLMDLERISTPACVSVKRLYGITATASFEYVLSCELVPSAVTT
jgi:hypothetical protein